MASPPDLTAWPRLVELAGCLCTEITNRGLPEPCTCSVLPGDLVAMDYCAPCEGKCGMAWVRLTEMYPSAVFPSPDVTLQSCARPLAYGVELGIVRCAPVGDDRGNPPEPADLMASAQLQMGDALAMRAALQCCYGQKGWVLGTYRPYGPQGTCVGGTWTAFVPE